MKISSRNVNGLRATIKKGFLERVSHEDPDILCLQEVKCFEDQIPPELRFIFANHGYVRHQGTRPGYAGTAIFYKRKIQDPQTFACFDIPEFSADGRVTALTFTHQNQRFHLVNCYFPNGGTRADGTEMLTYKLDFFKKMRTYLHQQQQGGIIPIVIGDFNICHTEKDIARPKENENSIGFLPIERAELDQREKEGYQDIFRFFYPDLRDQYTWRSYRVGAKVNNIGWRLDYARMPKTHLRIVEDFRHFPQETASDHCPIVLILKS